MRQAVAELAVDTLALREALERREASDRVVNFRSRGAENLRRRPRTPRTPEPQRFRPTRAVPFYRPGINCAAGPATRTMDIKPRHAGDDGGPDLSATTARQCRTQAPHSSARSRSGLRHVRPSQLPPFASVRRRSPFYGVKSCSGIWRPIALHGAARLTRSYRSCDAGLLHGQFQLSGVGQCELLRLRRPTRSDVRHFTLKRSAEPCPAPEMH